MKRKSEGAVTRKKGGRCNKEKGRKKEKGWEEGRNGGRERRQ